jgi:hypothetical protein
MPELVDFRGTGVLREVATEQELLDFVNRARAAGGADILEALLPSKPCEPQQCLIARGLNFSCYVATLSRDRWGMYLPRNMSFEQAKRIADGLECELLAVNGTAWAPTIAAAIERGDDIDLVIKLPIPIGNAADAFDEGLRFQNYKESV